MNNPEWMTVDQVAAFLQCSEAHVYKLIKSEQLPARRFGLRLLRVPRTALEGA